MLSSMQMVLCRVATIKHISVCHPGANYIHAVKSFAISEFIYSHLKAGARELAWAVLHILLLVESGYN